MPAHPLIRNLATLSDEAFSLRDILSPPQYILMVRDIYLRALEAVSPLLEEIAPLSPPLARLQLTDYPSVTLLDTPDGPFLGVPRCNTFLRLRGEGQPPFSYQVSIELAILVQAISKPATELTRRPRGELRLFEMLELVRIGAVCKKALALSQPPVDALLLAAEKPGRQAAMPAVSELLASVAQHPAKALAAAMLCGDGFFAPRVDLLAEWAPGVLEVLDELDAYPDSSLNAFYRWEALGLGLPGEDDHPAWCVLPHPVLCRLEGYKDAEG